MASAARLKAIPIIVKYDIQIFTIVLVPPKVKQSYLNKKKMLDFITLQIRISRTSIAELKKKIWFIQ